MSRHQFALGDAAHSRKTNDALQFNAAYIRQLGDYGMCQPKMCFIETTLTQVYFI